MKLLAAIMVCLLLGTSADHIKYEVFDNGLCDGIAATENTHVHRNCVLLENSGGLYQSTVHNDEDSTITLCNHHVADCSDPGESAEVFILGRCIPLGVASIRFSLK